MSAPTLIRAIALFGIAVTLAVAPASALKWTDDVQISQVYNPQPVLTVRADAGGYTQVKESNVPFDLYVSGSCTLLGKADISGIWIYRGNGTHYNDQYIDWGWNSRDVGRSIDIAVNMNASEKQQVVAACDDNLQQLQSGGMSLEEALGKDRVISGPNLYTIRHTFGCTGNLHLTGDGDWMEIEGSNKVVCEKAPPGRVPPPHVPPTGPGNLQQRFGVTHAEVDVTPENTSVITKANLEVSGGITANGPGKVKYRLYHNGKASNIGTLNFSKAGTHNFEYPLTVRCDQQQSSGNGNAQGSFASAPANVHTGHVRIKILQPTAGVRASEPAGYTVNCRETEDLAPSMPDFVVTELKLQPSGHVQLAVRNVGSASAPNSKVKLLLQVGDLVHQRTVNIKSLAAGDGVKRSAHFNMQLAKGATVKAVADHSRSIAELQEGNNSRSASVQSSKPGKK